MPIPENERKGDGRSKEEVYMVAVFHQLHCLVRVLLIYPLTKPPRRPDGHELALGTFFADLDSPR